MNEARNLFSGFSEDAQERSVRHASERTGQVTFFPPFEKQESVIAASLPARAEHAHHDDEGMKKFSEEKKPARKIEGLGRKRYFITGGLWLTAGLGLLALDNLTFHALDLFGGLPDLITAFALYHGYKQLNAAVFGQTTRDLTLGGTAKEIKGHVHQVIGFVKERLGKKTAAEATDLRWWLASE